MKLALTFSIVNNKFKHRRTPMLLIKNARIFTGTGEVLEKGQVLVEDGKIKGVGEKLDFSADCDVIDADGKVLTPGLIDVHTHLGVHEQGVGREGADFNETLSVVTPEVRAIDGINPREEGFETAREAGITTVQVMPGSANVLGDEMLVLKTVGDVIDKMVISHPSGMKAALGENPKRQGPGSSSDKPMTRMGIAAKLRAKLMETQDYIEHDQKKRDLGLEQLAKVLRKEIPLR